MSIKSDKAKELFLKGYNCSQAVVGAFCEDLGLDFETAIKLSSSFGGGMGRLREVCGTVSGIFLLVGLKFGYTDIQDKNAKINHYKLIQDIAERFRQKEGSIICREILQIQKDQKESYIPEDRTPEYYKTRPCVRLVETAALIAEDVLENNFYPQN